MSESRDREGDEQKTNNQAYEVDERVGLPNTREEYGAQELNQTSADSHRTPHSDVVLPQEPTGEDAVPDSPQCQTRCPGGGGQWHATVWENNMHVKRSLCKDAGV